MIADLARAPVFPMCLKRLLTGVSAISARLLYQIKQRHPDLCLINGYGPAEATVCATLYPVPMMWPETEITPIGRPVPNLRIFVLDPGGRPVETGEKGEICIAGIQVAHGYVNDPEQSAQKFIPNPFSDLPVDSPGGRMYKTGDLGMWLDDGNLMFSGRIDFQIKYKGIRMEPGEIEQVITAFPGISQAAVVLKKNPGGQERLTAYINADPDKARLMDFLAEKLPRALLPDVWIFLPALPRTSRGKIDRAMLIAGNDLEPDADAVSDIDPAAPPPFLTDLQIQVRQIWQQILKQEALSLDDHFLLLGGDSIAGVKILSRINQAFGTALTLDTLFTHPVLQNFTGHLSLALPDGHQPDQTQAVRTDSPEIPRCSSPGEGPLPLLADQHLIWVFEKLHPGTSVYHIPLVYAVQGNIDPAIFKQAVGFVARHHPALNLVAYMADDHPCQTVRNTELDFIHQTLPCALPENIGSEPNPDIMAPLLTQITRPFDLEAGPLFRTALFPDDQGRALVCFVFHHIIFDGWSAGLFIKDVNRVYTDMTAPASSGPAMSEHVRTGTDFLAYVARKLKIDEQHWDAARPFFESYLNNLPQPVQTDPTDFTAATCPIHMDATHLKDIRSLAAAHHTTPFAVLLLCFHLTLVLFHGEKDQVTGIAHAGRDQTDTEETIGFFMNTLVVRHHIRTDRTFIELLNQLKNILHGLMQYRHIPFYRISRFCREQGQSAPCFNALFLMQTMDLPVLSIPGNLCDRLMIQPPATNVDLTLELYEQKTRLTGWFKYRTAAFSPQDMETVSRQFSRIVTTCLNHPDTPLEDALDTGRFSVSPMQHAMLMETLRAPQGAGCYVEQVVFDMHQTIDPGRFSDAWNRVIACHSTLCLGFAWKGLEAPGQFFAPVPSVTIEFNDWSRFAAFEKKEYLDMFLKADRRLGFSLDNPPLFRIALIKTGPRVFTCIWSFHHCIADGRSMVLILKDLFAVYQDPEIQLKKSGSFKTYINWLNRPSGQSDKEFWTRQLKGFTSPMVFPFQRTGKNRPEARRQQHAIPLTTGLHQTGLPAETTRKIKQVCRKNHLTLNTFLMGAWAILLSHYTGRRDILFGATVSVRHFIPDSQEKTGLYINTLPVRIRIDPQQSLVNLVSDIRKNWNQVRRFQHMPLAEIQACSPIKGSQPLSEIYFSYDYQSLDAALTPYKKPMACKDIALLERTPAGIFLTVQGTDTLQISIEYDQRKFTSDTIEQILFHFQTCLKSTAESPDAPLTDLPVLTRKEQDQIAEKLNTRKKFARPNSCMHHLFEIQASFNPTVTAIKDSRKQVTYDQLNTSANQMAHYLLTQGAAPEKKVLVFLPQTADTIGLLLGILKSGCCYIPVDRTCPEERLRHILADAEPDFIATTEKLWEKMPSTHGVPILMDRDLPGVANMPETNPETPVAPENAAYIIYTSGSTGLPKGVVIEHASLTSFTKAAADLYEIQPSDRILQFASISFDASVEEIFPALYSGASLVIKPRGIVHTPSEFFSYCAKEQITIVDLPTAYWHMLTDSLETLHIPDPLRLVIIGGDAADPERVETWRRHAPGFVRLVNTYGPTETTVAVTFADLDQKSEETGEVPIGRPFPNVNLCILNHFNQPSPFGVAGELYIGGPQTARGYLNRPELTRDRFVPVADAGQDTLFFKTRDRTLLTPSGQIVFKGRMDRQVKIRGFRVEPGEIEKTATLYPGIEDCAVTVEKNTDSHVRTIAFIVLNPLAARPASGPADFDVQAFKSWLCARLPEYMCPSAVAIVKEFPRTVSGKTDYQALAGQTGGIVRPLFDTDPFLSDTGKERTSLSLFESDHGRRLKFIWEKILDMSLTDPGTHFFDAGGSSLTAIRLITAIEKEFKLSLPVLAVFRNPLFSDMAGLIKEKNADIQLSSVDSIQTRGDRTPVFFVAGTDENIPAFRHQDLDGHPFYRVTILAHRMEKKRIIPLDIWEIARQNVREIMRVQPTGPYIIIGFCRYAVTAFEIATQISSMGKTVEKLVLIDEFWQKKGMSAFVGHHIKGMRRFGIRYLLKKIVPKTREKFHRVSLELDAQRQRLYAATGRTLPEDLQMRLMEDAFWKAYESYIPMPYHGDAIILDSFLWNEKFAPQLRTYIRGNVDRIQVNATHQAWFDPDQIHTVIQCLKKR
jgi:amino acid adenylation domain-containing protein